MKILVIGASGGFGGTAARELIRRGHQVRALVRPGGRRPDLPGAALFEADALDPVALGQAAEGMDAMVWGFHLPYTDWDPKALEAAQVSAQVAERHGLTVLFPGNVYGLGPDFSEPIVEGTPQQAVSRKGRIRNAMEARFRQATEAGARVIVVRSGDYIGSVANTWLEEMTRRALRGGAIVDPGMPGVLHAWAYLPDVVRAGADLLEVADRLVPYEEVNVEGYVLDSDHMVGAIRAALGDPSRKVRRLPWGLLRLAGPFVPLIREVSEMRYLWQHPVRLDGTKLRHLLPGFRVTPLATALAASLAHFGVQTGHAQAARPVAS